MLTEALSGEGKFSLNEKNKLTQFCISFSDSSSSEHDLLDLLAHRGDSYHGRDH
jgi:hypothetical protein